MVGTPPDGGFWAQLGERERRLVLEEGHERRVAPGRRLYEEGQRAPSLVVILRGRVKVSSVTLDGEERLLALRREGDLLGEMATLTGRSRTATVTAIDNVRAVVVPADAFERLWRSEPAVLLALMRSLVHRVEEADRARMDLLEDAPTRVRRLLADLADRFSVREAGGAVRIDVALTQEELAGLAFASRGVVASVLRDLRSQGIVRTARKELVITDPVALERSARARAPAP
jgi:CRP-like cAMP-binding protein